MGCTPTKSEKKQDLSKSLRYFNQQNGKEHTVVYKNKDLAYIQLPSCFEEDIWSGISLTSEFVYHCYQNSTYLSVDVIPKDEMNYYKSYFKKKERDNKKDTRVLLDYVMDVRSSGLNWPSTSTPLTEITTEFGQKMLIGSVKGQPFNTNEEVFYQYGVVEGKEHYFILQSFMSLANAKLLGNDFITIFKTFETS